MSAPTLWEEGRTTGRRLIWLAVLSCVLVGVLDLLVFGRLTAMFDVGFVLVCVSGAVAVRPQDFFTVAVLPPFLLLGVVAVLGMVQPSAVAGAKDGVGQAMVAGLAHHSGALFAACVNALMVLAIRRRMMMLHADREARRTSPYAIDRARTTHAERTGRIAAAVYANLDVSPEPARTTSGAPEEKSTTVVGSAVVSPESRTASSF